MQLERVKYFAVSLTAVFTLSTSDPETWTVSRLVRYLPLGYYDFSSSNAVCVDMILRASALVPNLGSEPPLRAVSAKLY